MSKLLPMVVSVVLRIGAALTLHFHRFTCLADFELRVLSVRRIDSKIQIGDFYGLKTDLAERDLVAGARREIRNDIGSYSIGLRGVGSIGLCVDQFHIDIRDDCAAGVCDHPGQRGYAWAETLVGNAISKANEASKAMRSERRRAKRVDMDVPLFRSP